jgi:hypothetical protein
VGGFYDFSQVLEGPQQADDRDKLAPARLLTCENGSDAGERATEPSRFIADAGVGGRPHIVDGMQACGGIAQQPLI